MYWSFKNCLHFLMVKHLLSILNHLLRTSASLILIFCLASSSLAAGEDNAKKALRYAPRKMAIPLKLLPRDKYGLIDWAESVRMKLISPISSLDGSMEEKPYYAPVIIKSKMAVMTDALFPHDVHAYWLNCKTCHPGIFVQAKGGNIDMTMWDILDGKYCGRCHDRVAFPLRECYRCHLDRNVETTVK